MNKPVSAVTSPGFATGMPVRPPRSLRIKVLLPALLVLVSVSFWSLDLQWGAFFEAGAFAKMAEFIGGFFPPSTDSRFLERLWGAGLETVAMSFLGTVMAAVLALGLAVLAATTPDQRWPGRMLSGGTRLVLNALRSVPELVWAALLVISAGLGPFPGTLALAAHTTGVLGRLFADALENLPQEPQDALRQNGVSAFGVFAFATLPLALPQLMSYSLYRWENNIRAATVLGVVGAGGLGQLLYYHLSLFHMEQAASVVLAMLLLVGVVDWLSFKARTYLVA